MVDSELVTKEILEKSNSSKVVTGNTFQEKLELKASSCRKGKAVKLC